MVAGNGEDIEMWRNGTEMKEKDGKEIKGQK